MLVHFIQKLWFSPRYPICGQRRSRNSDFQPGLPSPEWSACHRAKQTLFKLLPGSGATSWKTILLFLQKLSNSAPGQLRRPDIILSEGVKIYSAKPVWGKCELVVAVARFVYVGGYSMAVKSLGAHKCDVFVKQQKVPRKKRARKQGD